MITLNRKASESFLIHPSEDLDPTMTVAELFSAGPIKVVITDAKQGDVSIGVDVPGNLQVIQMEQFIPGSCSG
jgi:hypothetical protein